MLVALAAMVSLAATIGLGAAAAEAPAVSAPPVDGAFSYQIGGPFPVAPGVSIVDRDRSARPAPGRYNICYVNAFQAQPDQRAWWQAHHADLLLTRDGRPVIDHGWGEQLLDTSSAVRRRALTTIIGGWMAGCAHAGFAAVEPDNLDSWQRSQGRLSERDNLALAALLIRRAHALGLAIAQKNAAEIAPQGRRLGFDFAIAEECQVYAECGAYTSVYGRRVIEIEYADNGGEANLRRACHARGAMISIVLRDRDVVAAGQPGFVERRCAETTG